MKAIIFDLDGTLVDSAPDIHAAANFLLKCEGKEKLDLETVVSFVGNGLPMLTKRVMRARGLDLSDFDRCYDILADYYGNHAADLTQAYSGVMNALSVLKQQEYSLGICTNKQEEPARSIVSDIGLGSFFDVIIGGDTTSVKKPNPEPLEVAVKQLGATKALYVGDSEVDAQTALNAGVTFALYSEGYRKTPIEDMPHDFVFSDFAKLANLVASWAENKP